MSEFIQDVIESPQGALKTGGNLDIDSGAAEQISSVSNAAAVGLLIKADSGNSSTVWIGPSTVTSGAASTTSGFPLAAGDGVFLQLSNINLVYAIASADNQKVYWLAV